LQNEPLASAAGFERIRKRPRIPGKQRRAYGLYRRAMKIVFVCSAYGGKPENVEKAIRYCRREVEAGNVPFAPHVFLPLFMSEATEREAALRMAFSFLERCDEIHVYGEITSGMHGEIERAKNLGMIIRFMEAE
jgi:hypothetical protein